MEAIRCVSKRISPIFAGFCSQCQFIHADDVCHISKWGAEHWFPSCADDVEEYVEVGEEGDEQAAQEETAAAAAAPT